MRPPPVPRRDSQAAASVLREALPEYTAHAASPEQRMRHDGRSALHSIVGFVELLESEALGPLSMEQNLSMGHIKASATRLFELLESSIDIAQTHMPLNPSALTTVCIARLFESTVRCQQREQPVPRLTYEGPLDGQRVLVHSDPEQLSKLLRMLLQAIAGDHPELWLWLTHTDLHAILTIGIPIEEHESITRSLPAMKVELAELATSAPLLSNRDYVRLKRCEALATRHQGRLLVSSDMSRLRLILPKVS